MARKRTIDHRTLSGENPADTSSLTAKEWWKLPDDEIASAVRGVVETIRQRSTRVEAQRQIAAKLYGNLNILGYTGATFTKNAANQPAVRDRITYNVIASVIDTITAKMAKNKPKPLFLTDGGDYKAQTKAKKLTKFVEGVFYDTKVRDFGPQSFKEAAIFGDALVKVFPRDDRVACERTLASNVFVDEIEGFYGKPRQMHQVVDYDRSVLAAMLPKRKAVILDATASTAGDQSAMDGSSVADQITVCESWHLPSAPGAGDGKHAICLPDEWLYVEEWTKPFFPFARLPWNPPVYGFWSHGLAEGLQNIQLEINKLLWLIQRSMHLMGTWKVALEYGSKIVSNHINNEIGAIIYYNEKLPVYLSPQTVPAEYYAHFERLKAAAYDQAGVSQLSATSQKPAGLDSGKALREYNDIESDRFQVVGQRYETFHLEMAKLIIDAARDIYERKGSYRVSVPERRFVEEIDWKEINLADDKYIMQVYPVSSLPQEPAGRLQTVTELVQAGMLAPQTGKRLLDFPDLDQIDSLEAAVEDRIYKMLDSIVETGEYEPPDPYLDLATARRAAMQYYNRAATQNVPEETLELLRQFMSQIDLQTAKAVPPPSPGVPAAPPQAVPEPRPESPLIPQVPQAAA